MKALLIKELRQLLPIAYLWMGLVFLGYMGEFTGSRVDEASFSSWCAEYCHPGSDLMIAVVLAAFFLMTAYSLFPREHDEATIDFLHSLPISRLTIFMAKFLAAWLLIFLVFALSHLLDLLALSLNPGSIDGQSYPAVQMKIFFRECIFAFVILSHGVFLSRFRTPGLVFYAIYVLLLIWAESTFGSTGIFNVLNMLDNVYDGQTLQLHWRAIVLHVLIAFVMLAFAYRLWNDAESKRVETRTEKNGVGWGTVVLIVMMFLVLTLMMSFLFISNNSSGSRGVSTKQTEYYRFVYPTKLLPTFEFIESFADADYMELKKLLNADSSPRIQADLTEKNEHAAGLATWKKIKMDLSGFEDDTLHRRVLSHETVHVFQAVESKRALSRNYLAVQFFIEGMAQYASFAVVKDEARRRSNWRLAAVAWHRQKITFKDLLDSVAFASKFDAELYYSLGDVWTDALVNTCSESVLGDFLRAAGRTGAAQDLSADLFWRDTLQHVGCELEAVNATWRRQMERLYSEFGDAEYPVFGEITSRTDVASGRILISATVEPSSSEILPKHFHIRVRASNRFVASVDSSFTGRLVRDSDTDVWRVTYSLPANAIPRQRFEFQPGFRIDAESRVYYEPWQTGNLE